ncbi:MAG: 4Fe-4S dicluster domain-containing protein [Planctomycetota bacterium]|nr:4Fe-4S dicluster domain-containing protein [Planctomycetota bacterium]
MLPKVLSKDHFCGLVARLLSGRTVYAPVAKGPAFAFCEIAGPDEISQIRMDYDISLLPPKKFFMPQRETLLTFQSKGPDGVRAEVHSQPAAILGVHPYDLHGIATLDAAFSLGARDAYYLAKRAATLLIGLNIQAPANDNQFAADMRAIDPPAAGYDLFLTDLGDRYYVEGGTPAGEALADDDAFIQAVGADHMAKQAYDAAKAAHFKRKLPYDTRYLPELLDGAYDSLVWDAAARKCFSCGTCTNVCPTCYCFDVLDKLSMDATSGTRERTWDSCQLEGFAVVAGGENFREERPSRLRHRMFRKGKYIFERTGRTGCVGCGRCITHCVAKISILEAFQQIADQVGA